MLPPESALIQPVAGEPAAGALVLAAAIRRHAERAPTAPSVLEAGEEAIHVCDASCVEAIRSELMSDSGSGPDPEDVVSAA
jgi:hypothetical protein